MSTEQARWTGVVDNHAAAYGRSAAWARRNLLAVDWAALRTWALLACTLTGTHQARARVPRMPSTAKCGCADSGWPQPARPGCTAALVVQLQPCLPSTLSSTCTTGGAATLTPPPAASLLLMPRSVVAFSGEAFTDCLHSIDEVGCGMGSGVGSGQPCTSVQGA